MAQNITDSNITHTSILLPGWIPQPDTRGSIDILWSCAFTVFLSSWSVLCLNVPAEDEGWWLIARRKTYWVLLTIMGPEIIFQLSLGEWLLARRWVREFQKSGYEDWTLTHSFYANMGGLVLNTPDHGRFPVNAAQLHHLLTNGYIDYPAINKQRILDKNKAQAIVRCLTLGQIIWFLVNCIARLHQGLALTTIEVSTLAFTFSAAGSFYCWYHKPMDIEIPDVLDIQVSVESIQRQSLGASDDTWRWTPLDFVDRHREWPWNIYWQCGTHLIRQTAKWLRIPSLVLGQRKRPAERLPDDYWPAPSFKSLPALFVFHVGYATILVAGWNLHLPTYLELLLWRIATTIQLGTIVSAWLTMPLMMEDAPARLQRVFSFVIEGHRRLANKVKESSDLPTLSKWYSRTSITEEVRGRIEKTRYLVGDDPNWRVSVRLLIVYQVTWLVYFTARMYIVVEDIASMRALPLTAFTTVNWSEYVPHV